MSTPTPALPFALGAHPSPPDPRDAAYALDVAGLAIPVAPGQIIPVDHRADFPPIQNQGEYQDCVTYSIADALAALFWRLHKKRLTPSHTFTNWNIHSIERTTGQNIGTYPRDAYKTLCNEGLCPGVSTTNGVYSAGAWPDGQLFHDTDPHTWKQWFAYVPDKTKRIYQGYLLEDDPYYAAAHFRGTTYRAVPQSADAVQAALVNGFDVSFAFQATYALFGINNTGDYPYPDGFQGVIGGHDMTVCGRLADGRFITRNQYGENWGDKGYAYLDKRWFDIIPPQGSPPLIIYDMKTWHAVAP